MNYQNYKVEDFLSDEDFKKWMLSSTPAIEKFWRNVVNCNPQIAETIEEARKITENIGFRYEDPQKENQDRVLLNIIDLKNSDLSDSNTEKVIQNIEQRISESNQQPSEKVIRLNNQQRNEPAPSRYSFFKIAAVIALILGVSLAFYFLNQKSNRFEQDQLSVNQITKQNPNGQKSHIKLPDGTDVWLNAASSISYQQGFSDTARLVNLQGEAYFEVVKDMKRPFRVNSRQIITTALGTSFNINAYKDENIRVSLVTGKVNVARKDNTEHLVLTPGQQAIVKNSGLSVKKFLQDKALAWKQGTIYFDNTDFDEMIRVLEKWYDVEFKEVNLSKEQKFMKAIGQFENETLENVLKVLSHSMGFEFAINRNIVTINFQIKQ